jgi:hypothetical protein
VDKVHIQDDWVFGACPLSCIQTTRETGSVPKNVVFWDVTPCRFCVRRRFGGTRRLHLQGRIIHERGTSMLLNDVSSPNEAASNEREISESTRMLVESAEALFEALFRRSSLGLRKTTTLNQDACLRAEI